MVKAKTWVKLREFSGTPTKDDFKLVEENLPELKDGGRVILFLFHKLSKIILYKNQNYNATFPHKIRMALTITGIPKIKKVT